MYHYRNFFFILGLVLYVFLFAGYINYSYLKDKEAILKDVDKELYNTAINLPLILPNGFHHKNMNALDYTKEQNLKQIKKLSKFVESTRLEYIYSIIFKDGKFYFSASSATKDELTFTNNISYSFDLFDRDEDSNVLKDIFDEGKPYYYNAYVDNKSFRRILLPMKAADSSRFMIGADMRTALVDKSYGNAIRELFYFLLPIFLLMLVYLIIGVYFHVRLEKIVQERTKEIQAFNLVDTLTGLPNRKSLIKSLAEDSHVHLAILNANGFQIVNDLYGNQIGDKLIVEMARSLELFIKDTDLKLYKLHADEFALLALCDMRQFDFLVLVERIIAQLHEKIYVINENKMSVLVSVGVASMVEVPLISATVALKEARKRNKKIYLYESHLDMATEIAHNQKVISEIHTAIKEEKIYPYFQPIYDVKKAKIVKYESLMRMEKADGTVEAPQYFLDIAHQSKLYNKLSVMMLQEVLKKAKSHPDKNFSFNLSAVDIEDSVMAEQILSILKRADINKQLTLEILETEGFRSYKTLAVFIAEVKSYGVEVAIDDFGSGYSNFAEIVELDVDYLKIDGSLVKKVILDTHYEHIVTAIIKFAHSLGLKTIAEFVEDESLAERLMEMGVDMLQGYYVGRPQISCLDE